jgi:iron complex outermembrane recepter protein
MGQRKTGRNSMRTQPTHVHRTPDRRGRRAYLAAALGATALTAPLSAADAFAQDVAAQGAAEAADDNVIIVTAQRRAQALEDVPMTVTVVTPDTLEAAGVTSLRDLQNVTTGFQLGQGGAFPQPAIRGVTTILNGTFENNVAIYVDGFYQVAPQAISIDLPNVESIQVLKGPQGTLYGRNATGGAILLNTISPGDTWRGKAELTYARFDDKRASAYVAGPLADRLGFSLAGYTRRSDGYHKFASRTVPGAVMGGDAAPLEQDSIRAKLKFDLTDDLSATVGYNYTHTLEVRGNLFTPYENVHPGYLRRPGGNLLPTKLGVVAYDFEHGTSTKQHDFTLSVDWNTGIGKLRSLTSYAIFEPATKFDFDGSYVTQQTTQTPANPVSGSYSTSNFIQETFQQSLDYTIDAIENVVLTLGGTYFKDDFGVQPGGASRAYSINGGLGTDPSVPPPESALAVTLERFIFGKKEAWAVYGDLTFEATDRLSLNVGGRYSEEKQEQATTFLTGTGAVSLPFTSVDAKFKKFTPRASVRYELAPRTNVYASYSQGFRSGAFPTFPPGNNPANWFPAKQEVVDAYEVGFKTAQGNLRAEIAGFYYDYKDLQVSSTQLVNNLPLVVIVNVPKAKIKGIEGSIDWEVFENFNVRAGATYLHARFGKDARFDGTGVDPRTLGINANDDILKRAINVTQQGQDLTGLQLPRAPDFSAFFGADYTAELGFGSLRFAANVKYTDSYVVTNPSVWCDPTARTPTGAPSNTAGCALVPAERQRKQRFREGNYALVNASVQWTDPTDHYYVRVFGTNLTDHRYRLHYTGTGTGTYSPMAEPRTYGVTVGYKFGN